MSQPDPTWILFNGILHKQQEPLLQAGSRAVRYGDGCFETLRTYGGRFMKFEAHMDRLQGGIEYLRMEPPFKFDYLELKESIIELLRRNGLQNGEAVVRIQVWREGSRGFSVPKGSPSGYAISVSDLPDISESVSLATVATRRIPRQSLDPRFKLSNSINYIRAATEAAGQSADDALMQTTDGHVSETTIANLFWLEKDTVFTPSRNCDILPGITRGIILELLESEFDVEVIEGEFKLEKLLNADAAWICNSVRELVPVRRIEYQEFPVQYPFFKELKEAFAAYRNKELE